MDARSIAMQTYLLQYLRKHKVRLVRLNKMGSFIHLEPAQITVHKIEISVRDLATFLADKTAPE